MKLLRSDWRPHRTVDRRPRPSWRRPLASTGRRWRERPADPALSAHIRPQYGACASPWRARLASRGVSADEAAETFLAPTLKALFPDPSSFLDMDRAAELLVDALRRTIAMCRVRRL